MATNLQNVLQILHSKTDEISQNEENWSSFLDSAARTYEFPFSNQVLIHAQKPDVAACAEIPAWNSTNRFVKKGTQGIALLAENNQRRFLRYVFDLNDTQESSRNGHGEENTIPWGWKIQPEYENVALSALQKLKPEEEQAQAKTLEEKLQSVVKHITRDVEPKAEHKEDVKRLLESSVAYVVMSRCNRERRVCQGLFRHKQPIP